MNSLEKARQICISAHAGQTRWGGEPYHTHPMAVADACELETEKIVALLHDVVEDTNVSLKDLESEGFGPIIIDAIYALTKQDNESYSDFIERCGNAGPLAITVKIKDIEHNLLSLPKDKKNQQRRDKYELAIKYLKMRDRIFILLLEY